MERRLAARTVELYAIHLKTLADNADAAGLALDQVQTAHVRRWMAQLHGAGREPRGIALVLSCWRSFYRWLGNEGQIAAEPGAGRARAQGRPSPAQGAGGGRRGAAGRTARRRGRPLGRGARPRDRRAALRLRPARGRTDRAGCCTPARTARGWVDLDAAEANVLGKGSKRRIVPVGAKAAEALRGLAGGARGLRGAAAARQRDPASAAALFIGRNGTRLSAQAVWKQLRQRSLQGRPGGAGASAHAAPFLRQPRAAVQQRPARGAGTAGPRQHRDHAGLHAAGFPASGEGLRRRASAGAPSRERRPRSRENKK